MKRNGLLLGSVVIILLLVFSLHTVGVLNIQPPETPFPYYIGSYKVCYTVPPYGLYCATIRYPATQDCWRALKDISEAPYPWIVVANGFAGSEWNIK